jgi:hypothetical protein
VVKWLWLAGFMLFWIAVGSEYLWLRDEEKKRDKDRFW